jgi:hypothetical protein
MVADIHTVSKTTIRHNCRQFGVKGYEFWSQEPLKIFRRWFLNEVAGNYREVLRPIGYGDDSVGISKAKFAVFESQRRRKKLPDVKRNRKIAERYKQGEKKIPEHVVRRSLRVMQQHVEARRSFGDEGPLAQDGKGKTCVRRGCNLEFGHKGAHSLL